MIAVLGSLVPVFAVIALGWAGKRWEFPGAAFWDGAERIAYFVLFPALLIKTLSVAPLDKIEPGAFAGAILAAMALNYSAGIGIGRALGLSGAQMGSLLQCGVRFNTYVGFAVAATLGGSDGFALFSVAVAVVVPIANVLSVWGLAYYSGQEAPSLGGVALQIAKNPFILSVLTGIALNLGGIEIPGFGVKPLIDMLAAAALFLGLASVGAGLDLTAVKGDARAVAAGTALKVVLLPFITWASCWLFGVEGQAAWGIMVYATLPVAPGAYVLARQMGGDAQLMAALITASTLAAAVTMPILLAILG